MLASDILNRASISNFHDEEGVKNNITMKNEYGRLIQS
jgi:hypothetical protein